MKLKPSNKTSKVFVKPLIKKGYYPAQLNKVSLYADKDGNAKVGTYGKSLIFEFAIYKGEGDDNHPVEPMTFKADPNSTTSETVIIPKFVYHQYLDKQNPGEFQSAVTPKSAITRVLTALGWTFSEEEIDPEDFVGNWVEVNVTDFVSGEGDDAVKCSTITKEGVQAYEGAKPSENMVCVKAKEKKEVKEQIKHEAVKNAVEGETKENQVPAEGTVEELQAKIEQMKKLNTDGLLTDSGLKDSIEQIEAQIDVLNKK